MYPYLFIMNDFSNVHTIHYVKYKSLTSIHYKDTSPPKNVLSNMSISLYQAKLAPASVVYFSWKDKSSGAI